MTLPKFLCYLLISLMSSLVLSAQPQMDIEVDAQGNDRFVLQAVNINASSFSALATRYQSGFSTNVGEGNITIFARNYTASPGYGGYFSVDGLDAGVILRANDGQGDIRMITGGDSVSQNTRMLIDNLGNVAIGTQAPASKLHIEGGALYLGDTSSEIILRSADGSCWTVGISNVGVITTSSVPCP